MVGRPFPDENGVAGTVGNADELVAAVAIKQAVVEPTVPAGVVEAFHPAIAAHVVAVRHRGNGGGETAVVNGEGIGETIHRAEMDLQRYLGDRHVASNAHADVKVDLVEEGALADVRQQVSCPAPT